VETKREQREEYNSLMLWMIAQPTRKEPEKLPRFGDTATTSDCALKKTGKDIMDELLSHGRAKKE